MTLTKKRWRPRRSKRKRGRRKMTSTMPTLRFLTR